ALAHDFELNGVHSVSHVFEQDDAAPINGAGPAGGHIGSGILIDEDKWSPAGATGQETGTGDVPGRFIPASSLQRGQSESRCRTDAAEAEGDDLEPCALRLGAVERCVGLTERAFDDLTRG